MSATSAIPIAQNLISIFAATPTPRFIKVSIKDEQLVHDTSIAAASSFDADLALLPDILEDHVPAYILANLAPSEWIAISYVPDSAKVRDKMLYASSRASLLRSLGSTLFTDSIFATTKADLTPDAYASHRRHVNAPQPLSPREQEMADARAVESGGAYEGSRARVNHVGTGVGFPWSQDLEDAVTQLAEGEQCAIVVVEIDRATETLVLKSSTDASIETLSTLLPPSQPSYAFFAWPHTPQKRDIIFIYACPSASPIKDRMFYSSGVATTYLATKVLLPPGALAARKIETSDPTELDEQYLREELGLDLDAPPLEVQEEKKAFARPKGPARRR
ncbi:hypothetical protein DXG01_014511 [Tephrocybe rancida]|nr:hypothetical protein DXG01_014511 [Tephrocybe rancida]